jgi:hypothetical protein
MPETNGSATKAKSHARVAVGERRFMRRVEQAVTTQMR